MQRTIICENCHQAHTYENSSGRRRKYCEQCRPGKPVYVSRECAHCGVEFKTIGRKNIRRHCTASCRVRAAQIRSGPTLYAPRCTIGYDTCRYCGNGYTVRRNRKGKGVCYQADCRAQSRADTAPRCTKRDCERPVQARGLCRSHYSELRRSHKAHTVSCAHCGKTAQKDRPGYQYCGRLCQQRAAATKRTERAAKLRASKSQIVPYTGPTAQPPTSSQGKYIWQTGQCVVCEQWFTTWNRGRTCSDMCRDVHKKDVRHASKTRRRARKNESYVADVSRRKVFKSDRYICHICGKKTDPRKLVPHPLAPTIDHVVPLAQGGTHEPANCRTAHFICNATKSDRGGGDQMLLLAV